uniref:Molybdate-anion transporter n=1 Tax=Palpitomonas bilix TaxID=652834 RepID=A0A7S3DMF5_9EUKA|mmetsp:Transcript_42432/g.109149  ORF Transcript_42432/g.109149 Transcript_42432/m.109149 type:complete len:452 (+) Transcript_42432:66-1421(+)|eukprot:CAMPEP_0113888824 /NCGR_PEP_ID=MMETSP0780_2-20120614/13108_1 /TAXON_ID=652834 /ORGANISM="Palpitomonas bilix" /LENGTH=451 /DNA_ID=CAMNT_0000877759 /DNA_START=66 /DNA_END=1421 /DNA_ORIENTATION=+ /assembly_acc=CAM_ASM_000599
MDGKEEGGNGFFYYSLAAFTAVLTGLIVTDKHAPWRKGEGSAEFRSFQLNYLVVFVLAFLGDWLQGPYVYALYEQYGFDDGQIGLLFIFGFASSMIFGTFFGSLADRYGRRKSCLIYCVTYALSCLTKHFSSFPLLLIGRVLGGIATSLLFSAFEAWMVHVHHHDKKFPSEWLSSTFGYAVFANGLCAIAAGVIGNAVKDAAHSYVAPFDAAIAMLVVCFGVIAMTWTENYGDSHTDLTSLFKRGLMAMVNDKNVMLLGLVQSLFEAAMYIFVFMWTPTLGGEVTSLPHGLVFSSFMVCVMVGGAIFNRMSSQASTKVLAGRVRVVFFVAAIALFFPVFGGGWRLNYLAFCVYEVCVGIFWPVIGTLRSDIVPETVRASVMNNFRIALNGVVVVVLMHIESIPPTVVFSLCFAFTLLAFFLLSLLTSRLPPSHTASGDEQRQGGAEKSAKA